MTSGASDLAIGISGRATRRLAAVLAAAAVGLAAALLTAGALSPQPAWDVAAAQAASDAPAVAALLPATRAGLAEQVSAQAAPVQLPAPSAAPSLPPAVLSSALPQYVGAIHGQFREQWFHSAALERAMRYFVYLPPGYEAASRSYPALYMLHGASGEAEEWAAYGFITRVDEAIAAGAIQPYLVVLPEGEFGYWVNHADDGPRWGDYVTRDLVAEVDRTYRTLVSARARAIGGLSMGAVGGLVQAFTHPSVFGVVGAHSPSLRADSSAVPFLGEGAEFAARDPLSLARSVPGLDRLKIWIDIGDEDVFFPRALALHGTLLERGVPHQWEGRPGDHWDGYWVENMPDYISFYHRALNNG
jgi:enterochelin esterase-like enzyme